MLFPSTLVVLVRFIPCWLCLPGQGLCRCDSLVRPQSSTCGQAVCWSTLLHHHQSLLMRPAQESLQYFSKRCAHAEAVHGSIMAWPGAHLPVHTLRSGSRSRSTSKAHATVLQKCSVHTVVAARCWSGDSVQWTQTLQKAPLLEIAVMSLQQANMKVAFCNGLQRAQHDMSSARALHHEIPQDVDAKFAITVVVLHLMVCSSTQYSSPHLHHNVAYGGAAAPGIAFSESFSDQSIRG